MKKPLLVIAAICLLIAASLYLKRSGQLTAPTENFEARPSKIELNAAQRAEMPKVPKDAGSLLTIYRRKNENGVWQILTQDESRDAEAVGSLHKLPVKGEVETPLYLCDYKLPKGTSRSLDPNPDCGPNGTAVQKAPLGYVSKLIRSGYLLSARCSSSKYGYYVSLNLRCENPDDHFSALLGAMRAAEVNAVPPDRR